MKKIFKSNLFIQVIVASMVAMLATAGIVGATTTIGANIETAGTLSVTSTSAFTGAISLAGTASTTGSAVIRTASIDSTTGAISFGDEDLSTSGTLASGALTVTGAIEVSGNASTTGSGILKSATINSDTGAISFGNEDLSTSGTLASGALTVTGLATLLGGATTTSITLLNGETISNATDGIITLTGQAIIAPARVSDDYAYGVDIDSDTFFTGGAAQKSYLLSVRGDRTVSNTASGDSNDAYIKIAGNNYAANDSNFILRGVNSGINNRSGGTLGILEGGSIGAQNKSGGTAPTVRGLSLTLENYGTTATEFGGIDVSMRNEAAAATTQYGIRVRNTDMSTTNAIAAGFLLAGAANGGAGNNTGFTYGLDMNGATTTAEIRLSNAETISNGTNGTVTVANDGGDSVAITPASGTITPSGGTISIAGIMTAATSTATTALVIPSGTTPSAADACTDTDVGALRIDTNAVAGSKLIICDGTTWLNPVQ